LLLTAAPAHAQATHWLIVGLAEPEHAEPSALSGTLSTAASWGEDVIYLVEKPEVDAKRSPGGRRKTKSSGVRQACGV
jgi:hypothetical protein